MSIPLILAGKQLGPWVTELRTACERARAELGDRELVIDLKDVTAISLEAENVLLQLMNNGSNSAVASLPNTPCGNSPQKNKP